MVPDPADTRPRATAGGPRATTPPALRTTTDATPPHDDTDDDPHDRHRAPHHTGTTRNATPAVPACARRGRG